MRRLLPSKSSRLIARELSGIGKCAAIVLRVPPPRLLQVLGQRDLLFFFSDPVERLSGSGLAWRQRRGNTGSLPSRFSQDFYFGSVVAVAAGTGRYFVSDRGFRDRTRNDSSNGAKNSARVTPSARASRFTTSTVGV